MLSRWAVSALGVLCMIGAARAEEVPRPEFPNPQLAREAWLNLNGTWEFAESNEDETERYLGSEAYPDTITVPFCRESPLSGIGRREFVKNVWYRRLMQVPEHWTRGRTLLKVGACDWQTRVYVNGKLAGEHVGGNVSFSVDITDYLEARSAVIVIHAYDDTAGGLQPLGKQSIKGESFGIFYTPTTGIWQTVWLENVAETHIRDFRVVAEPEKKRAVLTVNIQGPLDNVMLRARAVIEGEVVASVGAPVDRAAATLMLPIGLPRLWSPEDPFLYDLSLEVLRGDKVVDAVGSYFGMRTVSIDGPAILLNGKHVFQRLVLDQGFYPDGIWTAPSDAALKADIELSMAAGFNGARLHQKVFEPRFLYWADRLGYLVWGEYPSFGANYDDERVRAPILREWTEIVNRDFNHPSIIGWCPFNETPPSAGPVQAAAVTLTRVADPTRPVLETSGWTHTIPDPRVLDAHDYDQVPASFRARWTETPAWKHGVRLPERYGKSMAAGIPFFVSEYGGIGWSMDEKAWGYGNTPENLEAFYVRLEGLTKALLDNRYMFGYCYTQLTNVEQEQNGIYYYDRTPKFDMDRIKGIFSAPAAYETNPPEGGPPKEAVWSVLVGARADGDAARPWRHRTEAPPKAWSAADFDDRAWAEGLAPFGLKGGAWMEQIRTPWKTNDLWVRQAFEYGGEAFSVASVVMHHDDAVEIFLNGEPLFSRTGWNDTYDAFDVTEAVRAAVKPGRNVIAAHVHQDRGGQFFDLALLLGSWAE